MNILIVGNSTLGHAVKPLCHLHTVHIVGRQEYDLAHLKDCEQLVNDYAHDIDCVVFTQGTLDDNIWNNVTVNYTSMIYLIAEFYKNMSKGQIIAVSSATVNWTCWPGIPMERLVYACNKTGVSEFCKNLNRKNVPDKEEKPVSIQVYEPNSFDSKMGISNQSITDVAKELHTLIENPRISVLQGLNRHAGIV